MRSPDEPFDPLAEAKRQWHERGLAEPLAMYAAVSVIRAQQVVTTTIDRALKPLDLTFARYEVLMLLAFSRRGALPVTKVGERLLVHPTGITRLVDKLEAQGLVRRAPHPEDRRSVLVAVTPAGRRLAKRATKVLGEVRFGFDVAPEQLEQLVTILQGIRAGEPG